MKTKQEIFDFVAKKLIEQGRPSVSKSGMCRYRSNDGAKCAAGHLIPDDEYRGNFENYTASCVSAPTFRNMLNLVGAEFMNNIQRAHDGGNGMTMRLPDNLIATNPSDEPNWLDNFKARMRIIANHYGLNAESVA